MRLSKFALDWMHGQFSGWSAKNQPAAAYIDCLESQNIAEEFAIGRGILAVEQDVKAKNHRRESSMKCPC